MKVVFAVTSSFCFICGTVLSAQAPTINKVVDAAAFSANLAPGILANVTGVNFGTSTAISVTVGGKACAVLSASPTALQIQIAVDAPLGPTTIQVGASAPFKISLAQYAPELYSADGTGHGDVQAYHANFSLVTPSSPATAGEVILVYAIGMGPTDPVVPTGAVAPPSPTASLTTAPSLTVANQSALVLFAGLAPGKIGVSQINFLVPGDVTTGDQPISVVIGGVSVGAGGSLSNILTLPTSDAPIVTGIQNNFSYIAAGLPNYGIAQGSIFIIYGSNLASADTPSQSGAYPLPTSLGDVSVSVTVNGTTTHPILYYASPPQLTAILPSNTPAGAGQITVTKHGETGPPAPILVVPSAFGLLTLNAAGPAAAQDANFGYLGLTNSVHPGEIVNFWGSGLGPTAGDETNIQTPADLTNIPIEVDIGGISATVIYHGRSNYPGLDQIQAIVPAGVQPGCNVSVSVRTGNISSNFGSIPVAANGRTCSEPELGVTPDVLQSVMSKLMFTFGTVNFQKDSVPQLAPQDRTSAQFSRFATPQFNAANLGRVSIGSCSVSYYGFYGGNMFGPLDAGPAINISGPAGKATLIPSGDGDGFYDEFLGSDNTFPIFIPASGGMLNFDNGAGGPDVGSFTSSLTLGAPLVWTNEAAFASVNRSQGLTVTWTGGAPNSFVQISGMSAAVTGAITLPGVSFTCAAPVAANQFTVPSTVLLALPAFGSIPPLGTLSVSNIAGQTFTAPGLDLGLVSAAMNFTNIMVTYQ